MNKNISNLSPTELKSLIDRGILQVKMNTAHLLPTSIEQTPEYKKFLKLKGKTIGVSEAARKYDIPQPTITNWKKRGFIPVLGQEGAQKLLLDESYVAYCAHVFKKNRGQGKKPFNQDGTPYVPKTYRVRT